jgi:hypothetical protein
MLDLTKSLAEARVVPVLRGDTPEQAIAAARRLGAAGRSDLPHRFLDPNPTGETP